MLSWLNGNYIWLGYEGLSLHGSKSTQGEEMDSKWTQEEFHMKRTTWTKISTYSQW